MIDTALMPTPSFTKIPACWICESPRLRPIHESRFNLTDFADSDPELLAYHNVRFIVTCCADCGFMQPEGLPAAPDFFERLYAPYHDMQLHTKDTDVGCNGRMSMDFEQGSKDLIFRRVLRELGPAHGSRLLDIGAHVGRLLFLANQRGWLAEGWEVNPKTAEFARHRTGAKVTTASVAALAKVKTAEFDAVTIIDVLEHIPDPVSVLRNIYGQIVPGGRIAVKVPCGTGQLLKEWLKSKLRPSYEFSIARNMYHVNHFTPGSLCMALKRAGFANVRLAASPPEVFRPESFASAMRTLPSNTVRTLHYWMCGLPGFKQIGSLNFHLLAFAKRPK